MGNCLLALTNSWLKSVKKNSSSHGKNIIVEDRLFSSILPTGPMRSIIRIVCPCVCLCVCLSVCLSPFHTFILRPILTPLPEVGSPMFLELRIYWGKVLERSGLIIEHFCWEVVKNRPVKKS